MPEATAPPRDAGRDHHRATSWTLDVSCVRPLAESITGDARQPDWVDAVLAGTRIVDVTWNGGDPAGYAAPRDRMVGQSVAACWPPESRAMLAELIVAVMTDGAPSNTRVRRIAPGEMGQTAVLTIWRTAELRRADTVFLAVNDAPKDDRPSWYSRASEERYLNLVHHMQTAMMQVDASCMSKVYDRLRAEGLTELDLDRYLKDHAELIDFADEDVRVTEANLSAASLLGCSTPAEVIGPVAFMFTVSPDTQRRIMIARFGGKRHYAEVMKLVTFDGRLRDVRLSITFPAPREDVDIHLVSLEDVTDRLRTETQLRQLQADLTHAARISTLGELATSIAHEVNQPLAAIVTNAETSLRWLSREEPNLAKVRQLTMRIAQSAQRASDIVRRIRGMTARHAPERVPLDLNEIVDEALLFVRHEIDSRSIDLSLKLGQDIPPLLGDRVQLQQVIVNLLLNGIQAMTSGGGQKRRIELGTSTADGRVAFSMRDTGPGVAPENLDRIFDSFFTTKDDGMGIGLAICQSIITAHGGAITVSNHPEGGALFQFSLPAA
jgi:C4-dicarboxylate-specific signal transduction histidine kinase